MPRANRHRIAGQVWHITQRCHRREFLLKFARDRRAWAVALRSPHRPSLVARVREVLARPRDAQRRSRAIG